MATTYRTLTSISASGIADLAADQHSKAGTLSGDSDIVNDTQDIGLTSEIVSMGEISAGSAEAVEITNLDATNFVSIGFTNPVVAGTLTFRISAGQSALFARPSAALYAIADTGTVKILKRAFEV